MIYSIPKYINNLKSQKIKFVKLNIHVPNLDAKFTTGKNSSYNVHVWLLLIKKFQVDNVVFGF